MLESLSLCAARSLTTIGGPSRVSLKAGPSQDPVTINTLPDDVLVDIFHFYVDDWDIGTNGWHTLVHVCQRWRYVVFASPRRLNLRLWYTGKRPMAEMLDVWPVLPVVIRRGFNFSYSWENLVGALESEHRHRICKIHLSQIPASHWGRSAAAIQKPFPELTYLWFSPEDNTATSIPNPLGGSAPLLQELRLFNCPFQGPSKLLLSAKQLVHLSFWDIPDSGYISPQDLGTALSVLSRLESLDLRFRYPRFPASRPRPPLTRSVLPALARFEFKGVQEYLEDLLAQIEVPFLDTLRINFFMDPEFVLPQLHRLISHAKSFETCDKATVHTVRSWNAMPFSICLFRTFLSFKISCRVSDSHLASLTQVCSSTFPLLSNLIQLEIVDDVRQSRWSHDMETTQWLELLDPFIAVKDLRLCCRVAPHVCRALAKKGLRDVLPALQNIYLSGLGPLKSVPKYMEGFVAARKFYGHPVAVHRWK